MIKRFLLSALGSMLITSSLSADVKITPEQKREIREQVEPYLSVKRPYPFPKKYASAPAQCRLVHINHLGRHGSRHLTSEKDFQEDVVEVLQDLGLVAFDQGGKARVADNPAITEQGRTLVERMLAINDMYLANPGLFASVTAQGKNELRLQGSRLFMTTGMSQNAIRQQITTRKIRAESTAKERTHTSRTAFLNGLSNSVGIGSLETFVDEITPKYDEIDRQLRFYDHCSAYIEKEGPVKAEGKKKIKAVLKQSHVQRAFYRLGNTFVTGLTPDNQKELVMLMYKLCQLDANLDYQLGICSMYLKQGGKNNSLHAADQSAKIKQFYKRGSAEGYKGMNRAMAVELLDNWLDTTEAAVRDPNHYFANLRFAHDSTLLRFEQILDLVTPNNVRDENGNIDWDLGQLAPMSANVVWQTYSCQSATPNKPVYRVRMLLNDEVTPFPISKCDASDGLCDWEKVRNYYRLRMQGLSLDKTCGELVVQQEKSDE